MTDEAKRCVDMLREGACCSYCAIAFPTVGYPYPCEERMRTNSNMDEAADLIESLSTELEATEAIAALARGLEFERDQLQARLEHVEYERDALMKDVSGYCSTCAFLHDCAKHDLNDSAPFSRWYYGDCEDWQWRGAKEESDD